MKKKPWDRALHRFLPYCMILVAATTKSVWLALWAFALCFVLLWFEERNKDEDEERQKVIVDELMKIGERKP